MRRLLAITLVAVSLNAAAAEPSSPPRKLVLRERARWTATDAVVQRVQFAPDGKSLVVASGGGEASLWTLAGEARGKLAGQRSPMFNAVFSPGGDTLATTGYDGTLRLWPLPASETFRTLKVHRAAVNDVAFCGSTGRVVTGSDEGVARLWQIHEEKLDVVAEVQGAGTVRRVACDAAHGRFANSFDSGEVQVTAFSGRAVARFDSGQHRLNAIALARDGKRLLTGSTDGSVKLWTTNGRPLLTRRVVEKGWVNDARFSPDGRLIAVATDDGHVRVYDLSGSLLADQAVTKARATSALFSADGRLLAGGSSTGEAFVFEVADE